MGKIISFCGRMKNGKTELAKICEKYGYTRMSFAIPLKQLCADILNISIDGLNKAKNEHIPIQITINDDICNILSEETNIPLDVTRELCHNKHIETVRDMLQFIGTDYIRKYNQDWHVNRILELIDKNTNYVFDDVRFPNEKKMIEELGGDCWFVTRTSLDNISNHESETSITWQQCFNKVIINNSTLYELQFKWDTFVQNYNTSCKVREEEFNRILENGTINEIVPFSLPHMLMLSKSLFTYIPKEFNKDEIQSITMNEDKSVFIKYNDDTIEMIENELTIEELKMFC